MGDQGVAKPTVYRAYVYEEYIVRGCGNYEEAAEQIVEAAGRPGGFHAENGLRVDSYSVGLIGGDHVVRLRSGQECDTGIWPNRYSSWKPQPQPPAETVVRLGCLWIAAISLLLLAVGFALGAALL